MENIQKAVGLKVAAAIKAMVSFVINIGPLAYAASGVK